MPRSTAAANELEARVHELRERAAALAAPIHQAARASTTVACERAMLRLFGVAGLDRRGRPLALEVVDRFAQLGPGRLGGGVALPFAAAAHEYDLEPQELALEIASGHVDLALEADLLREPENRSAAERLVGLWLATAWERFDANRTARGELRAVFGDGPDTVLGLDVGDATAGAAMGRARELVADGADVLRVRVPRDRELRRGLGEELDPPDESGDARDAPAGSQCGLAVLRTALDEAAAAQGRYVRLASQSLGLASPDQAVVAGFERVDLVCSDPLESIVEFGVEPARAFTDHAFALEVHGRSGAQLALGPGPLAVAPEIARGEPIDPPTRSGRALALQALGVELTRLGPLPPERVLLGAGPRELRLDAVGQLGIGEVALRRLAFPEHPLLFVDTGGPGEGWALAFGAWAAGGAPPAVVLRPAPSSGSAAGSLHDIRVALEAASWLDDARGLGPLKGLALEHARASLRVALETLRRLASDGWEWLLSVAPPPRRAVAGGEGAANGAWLGASGPVLRRDAYDPFAARPVLG
ncbi:MAG: lysine 5,6-aminomutase subunit alpha TIM-barrel domain-containing protein [Candidatus Limnocylindrales bacterium]